MQPRRFQSLSALVYLALKMMMTAQGEAFEKARAMAKASNQEGLRQLLWKQSDVDLKAMGATCQGEGMILTSPDQRLMDQFIQLGKTKELAGHPAMKQIDSVSEDFKHFNARKFVLDNWQSYAGGENDKKIMMSKLAQALFQVESARISAALQQSFLSLDNDSDLAISNHVHKLQALVAELAYVTHSRHSLPVPAGVLPPTQLAERLMERFWWRQYLGHLVNGRDLLDPRGIDIALSTNDKLSHLWPMQKILGVKQNPARKLALKALRRYSSELKEKVVEARAPGFQTTMNELLEVSASYEGGPTLPMAVAKALSDPFVGQLTQKQALFYHAFLFQISKVNGLFWGDHIESFHKARSKLFTIKSSLDLFRVYLDFYQIMNRLKLIGDIQDSRGHKYIEMVDALKSHPPEAPNNGLDTISREKIVQQGRSLYDALQRAGETLSDDIELHYATNPTSLVEETNESDKPLSHNAAMAQGTGNVAMVMKSREEESVPIEINLPKFEAEFFSTLFDMVDDITERWNKANKGGQI